MRAHHNRIQDLIQILDVLQNTIVVGQHTCSSKIIMQNNFDGSLATNDFLTILLFREEMREKLTLSIDNK